MGQQIKIGQSFLKENLQHTGSIVAAIFTDRLAQTTEMIREMPDLMLELKLQICSVDVDLKLQARRNGVSVIYEALDQFNKTFYERGGNPQINVLRILLPTNFNLQDIETIMRFVRNQSGRYNGRMTFLFMFDCLGPSQTIDLSRTLGSTTDRLYTDFDPTGDQKYPVIGPYELLLLIDRQWPQVQDVREIITLLDLD